MPLTRAPDSPPRSDSGAESFASATSAAASVAPECSPSSPESSTGQKRRLVSHDTAEREPRKPRTRWYALQKEERALLEKEAADLETHLDFLQHMPENRSAARVVARLQRENEQLRCAMQSQQVALAGAQSALASYSIHVHNPFTRPLRLSRDAVERRAALLSHRDASLADSERYLRERSRFLDPTQKYTSLEKWTTPRGDFVVQVFEAMALPGVPSVQCAFDALRFFFFNLDIALTESSGELVVRESKDELAGLDVTHQRILRTTARGGLHVESNCVMAACFCQPGKTESDVAVITMDTVADDALFPYRPDARIRQDITAALMLRAVPRRVTRMGDDAKKNENENENDKSDPVDVVICRSYTSTLHHSASLVVPSEVMDGTVVMADMCSREILRTVHDVVKSLT